MKEADWKKFIQEAKNSYYKIGAVPCLVFGGELVYFNRHGWSHLFRKGRFPRDTEEQCKRMRLMKYAEYILRRSVEISDYRENVIDKYPAYFWTINRYIDGINIRIVIRKLNNGRKHFFSIMDDTTKKPPKK